MNRSKITAKIFYQFFKMGHPEEEILIGLLKGALPNKLSLSQVSKLRSQIGQANIQKLENLIATNKLSTLLFEVINNSPKVMPESLVLGLKKSHLMTNLIMQGHREEAKFVLETLLKAHCNFVVMKTYLLKKVLFLGKEIKVASDLDIFITPGEFDKVYSVLTRSGFLYIPDARWPQKSDRLKNLSFFIPSTQETFIKQRYFVEVHTSLIDNHNLLALGDKYKEVGYEINSKLFSKTMLINFKKMNLKVFSPSGLVVSLFLHTFFQHNMEGVIGYYEVASVFKKHRVDWNYITKFLQESNLSLYFNWYLLLMDKLFPGVLNGQIKSRLRKFEKGLNLSQTILFYYLRHKVFRPTNFLKNQNSEVLKELTWSIMDNKLGFFVKKSAKKWLVNRFKSLVRIG